MPAEFSMPLVRRELSDETISQILTELRSSGILIHRDRLFSGGEVTDYYFRAFIETDPVVFDLNDEEEHDVGCDALLKISPSFNTIEVLSVVRMSLISFGRFIGTNDVEKAVAVKIPDEYYVDVQSSEEDAISLAEKCLRLFFIWLERKSAKEGNIFVTVSRSRFYDDIKIMDKDRRLFDVFKPLWFNRSSK